MTAAVQQPTPLILDVDTGIDDSLALLLAAASPRCDLLGVTTCAGNVEIDPVLVNTLGMLALAGRSDVPVLRGHSQPLVRPLETTPETHGPHGLGYADLAAIAGLLPAEEQAAEFIVEQARSRPGEVTLVTLAPLTNLARAVMIEPRLPWLLRKVLTMGGAFGVGGNTSPTTEWNVHVDPEAVQLVLAGWQRAVVDGAEPLLIAGLNVTEKLQLLPEHLAELTRRAGLEPSTPDPRAAVASPPDDAILRTLFDAFRFYFEFHEKFDGFYGAFIHDPFVVAAALDGSLIETTPAAVDVVIGGMADGQTIADVRQHWARPANAEVAVEADEPAFFETLLTQVAALVRERRAA